MPKTVCVVGAGPSGLVAAKSLLHDAPKGYFNVTVFDTKNDIGGLWPTSKTDTDRMIHPLMVINQSKHTVAFGDLAWGEGAPQLPQAWAVGQYLQRYHDYWLRGEEGLSLELGTKVTHTERHGNGWKVSTEANGSNQTRDFDFVLVASGVHGKPFIPQHIIEASKSSKVPVIHSSRYRDLKDILGTHPKGKKILVVGSQQSAIEISSTIALQLSAAQNSPQGCDIPDIDKYYVHQAMHTPMWNFPLFTSPEPTTTAPPFVPLDLNMYNRSNRPKPLEDIMGHITEDQAKQRHGLFEMTCGTDQSTFSDKLQITQQERTKPPLVGMNDFYCELVRAGNIVISNSKLQSLGGDKATLHNGEVLDDVAAVVAATGFDSTSSLDFLPPTELDALHFDSQYQELPVALAFHETHHPKAPGLGFVGYYRGPYWGVMQLQAQLLAKMWSSQGNISEVLGTKLSNNDGIQRTLSLRGDPRLTQFPTDYSYIMQELGEALELKPYSPSLDKVPRLSYNQQPLDALVPAHYLGHVSDAKAREQARQLVEDCVQTTIDALTTPRFVSWAVFRSLLGTWKLERDLTSKLPSHPSGHFSGTAKFFIREQTLDGRQCVVSPDDELAASGSSSFDQSGLEYLYVEEGEFQTAQGFRLKASRSYVWRYDEKRDKINVWFVKPEDPKQVDYLFHDIDFEQPSTREEGWPAKAGHLCIDDYYDVKYNFSFKAVNLERWSIEYEVKGPKKDYTIHGIYTR